MWQQAKSRRKKKTLPLGVTASHPSPLTNTSYHSRLVPEEFFRALDINTPNSAIEWNCKVVPLYSRKIPTPQHGEGRFSSYYLVDVATTQRRIVRIITVTRDTTIKSWIIDQTKDYVLDQIAEAMRTIMLHNHKYCPLRCWTDASWFYTWSITHACCLLFPFEEVAQDNIRVQRPTNYAWLRLPKSLEGMAGSYNKGGMQHYEMEESRIDELLSIGVMEEGTSPSKPPKKKTKGHTIPIHTEIVTDGTGGKSERVGARSARRFT